MNPAMRKPCYKKALANPNMGILKFRRPDSESRDRFPELTYANANDPVLKRWIIRRMEKLSGRDFFASHYEHWRTQIAGRSATAMGDMLDILGIRLTLKGAAWPPARLPDSPLVMIANHPFGIGDGVAILSLAERLGRPYRVIINNELLKIPEIRSVSLPISFEESKEALRLNLETRKEAVRLLHEGVTIVVFPAGGVATAPKGFGLAVDLPWKLFPAKLIQSANAAVIPVCFEGQCGRLFHIASRISMTARTSLLIREFRRLVGKEIVAHVGPVIESADLAAIRDRNELTRHLHHAVFSMRPEGEKRWRIRRRRDEIREMAA